MSGIIEEVYAFTKRKMKWIESVSAGNNKAMLAELRKGIGKKPGEDPRLWGILFEGMPESLMSRKGEPTEAEWAVYTAITTYAVHQQGKDVKTSNMDVEGVKIGQAMAALVKNEEDKERVERRFFPLATAEDMQGISHYLREIVQLLRSENIGFDYAFLSRDLYLYQFQEHVSNVRLRWGQDFYSYINKSFKEEKDNG